MSHFQTFLNELAQVLEFSELKPDRHGACLIVMKSNHAEMLFEFDDSLVPNSILVSSPIAEIHVGQESEVYTACLKGNGEMEHTLSKRPDEDRVYLHRRIHPDIHAAELKPIIETFLEAITQWHEKLARIGV